MRGADYGKSFEEGVWAEFFGSAQIDEVDFSTIVNYWVFWFKIAIDNTVRMQALDGDHKAGKVILDHFQAHGLDFTDDIEHLLPVDVLHEEKDEIFIVECFHETHNIRKDSLL